MSKNEEEEGMKYKIPIYVMALLALIFLFPMTTNGQILFSQGTVLPQTPLGNEMFWNLETKRVWSFEHGEWKDMFLADVQDVQWCHSWLVFTRGDLQYICFIDAEGKRSFLPTVKVICHEGLMVDSCAYVQRFADTTGRYIGFILEKSCIFSKIQHVGAESGYCIPKKVTDGKTDVGDCSDLNTWGFITVKGQWLVVPKFDAPFRFKNGIADVLYYGKKCKINEQGEFVD